jgi:hypothetical protein
VHDHAGRDEMLGDLLGQVEDRGLPGRLDGRDLVGQVLAGGGLFAIDPGERGGLRALRVEADLLLEEHAGGPADPQGVRRMRPGRLRLGQLRVLVEPRLDPEAQEQ